MRTELKCISVFPSKGTGFSKKADLGRLACRPLRACGFSRHAVPLARRQTYLVWKVRRIWEAVISYVPLAATSFFITAETWGCVRSLSMEGIRQEGKGQSRECGGPEDISHLPHEPAPNIRCPLLTDRRQGLGPRAPAAPA